MSLFLSFSLSFHFTQPTHYVTITTRRNSTDTTDSPDVERVHLKKLVGQLKNNLYNVSVLSEPDLEMITNMDPNSVADITGKDFIEQLKEVSGRLAGDKSIACDLLGFISDNISYIPNHFNRCACACVYFHLFCTRWRVPLLLFHPRNASDSLVGNSLSSF